MFYWWEASSCWPEREGSQRPSGNWILKYSNIIFIFQYWYSNIFPIKRPRIPPQSATRSEKEKASSSSLLSTRLLPKMRIIPVPVPPNSSGGKSKGSSISFYEFNITQRVVFKTMYRLYTPWRSTAPRSRILSACPSFPCLL